METSLISEDASLKEAASILKTGGLVATPTETVYGLCANAFDEQAIRKIYQAKGRPSDNPLIVHIASLKMLDSLVTEISDIAHILIEHFWPGPMTLIFKANPIIPKVVTGGLNTVAIRFPSHPTILKLIKETGLPLAAPSANLSGKPSPTTFERVFEDLNGKIDCIIKGMPSKYGVESTVIDTTGPVATILRPGGITYEMLHSVITVQLDQTLGHALKQDEIPLAPGMKYTHYAPNAKVIIVRGSHEAVIRKMNDLAHLGHIKGKKVGLLATNETFPFLKADIVLNIGSEKAPITIASHLFEALRQCDDAKVDFIYSPAFKQVGIGQAIMNRLEKSAGYHFIDV